MAQAERQNKLFAKNLTWLTFWLPVPDDSVFVMLFSEQSHSATSATLHKIKPHTITINIVSCMIGIANLNKWYWQQTDF